MSVKKRFISALTAFVTAVMTVLGFSGCSSQVNYAMVVDGENIPSGLYILYSGYAYMEAQDKLAEEQPDLDTSAEGFDYTAQKVEDKEFMTFVRDRAVEMCKRHVVTEKLFDQLGLTLDEETKKSITDAVNEQWDYEVPDWISSSMEYIVGHKTVGDFYESLGVSKSSYKMYITDSQKASQIFQKYYGEGGLEEVPKADKEKWLDENYTLCRYFSISLKDSDGEVIESKTQLALLLKQAQEYADKLNDGESYKDVYAEYQEYNKAQTSTGTGTGTTTAPAETNPDETTPAVTETATEPEEITTTAPASEEEPEDSETESDSPEEAVTTVSDDEPEPTEAESSDTPAESDSSETKPAETTAAGTTTKEVKDSDYDRIVGKTSTSPSENFVKELFKMNKGTAAVIQEDTAYYVVQRLDVLTSDQDYVTKYDSSALQGLKGEDMDAVFAEEFAAYSYEENKSAPDYCKQQAENAAHALSAVSDIQYLIYYYSSYLGGMS